VHKTDALHFTSLCGFVRTIGDPPRNRSPIVLDHSGARIYGNHGIDFQVLSHLESLGLIRSEGLSGFILDDQAQWTKASYFGSPVSLVLPNPSGVTAGNS